MADDFKSLAASGRPAPPTASAVLRDAWEAVSVFVTPEAAARQARANAARGRPLGDYNAEFHISADAPIRADEPGPDRHVNLWADPAVLLAAVQLPAKSVDNYRETAARPT